MPTSVVEVRLRGEEAVTKELEREAERRAGARMASSPLIGRGMRFASTTTTEIAAPPALQAGCTFARVASEIIPGLQERPRHVRERGRESEPQRQSSREIGRVSEEIGPC